MTELTASIQVPGEDEPRVLTAPKGMSKAEFDKAVLEYAQSIQVNTPPQEPPQEEGGSASGGYKISGEDVGNFFTEDVPKFVTEDIPEAFDKSKFSMGGAAAGAAAGALTPIPGAAIVGGILGGMGGSVADYGFGLEEGEEFDYMKAAQEAAISLGFDVATLGLGKLAKMGWAAANIRKGVSPDEAVRRLASSKGKQAADYGTDEATAQAQLAAQEAGTSLSPFQSGITDKKTLLRENLGRTGIFSQNVYKKQFNTIVASVQQTFEEIANTTPKLSSTSIGHRWWEALEMGKEVAGEVFSKGMKDLGEKASKDSVEIQPLKDTLTNFMKQGKGHKIEAVDELGNVILDNDVVNIIKTLSERLGDNAVASGNYPFSFYRQLDELIKGTTSAKSKDNSVISKAGLAQLSALKENVLDTIQKMSKDGKITKEFLSIRSQYGKTRNALFPKITNKYVLNAKNESYSDLGEMFLREGNADQVRAAMVGIRTAYKRIAKNNPERLKDLHFKTADDALAAVKGSYLNEAITDITSGEFSKGTVKRLTNSLSDVNESRRIKAIMGKDFTNYKKTVNLLRHAMNKPESGLATLWARSKEFGALTGVGAAIATGGVVSNAAVGSLGVGATVFLGPMLIAKASLNPKRVNKLLQLEKINPERLTKKEYASKVSVILNDFIDTDLDEEMIDRFVNYLTMEASENE